MGLSCWTGAFCVLVQVGCVQSQPPSFGMGSDVEALEVDTGWSEDRLTWLHDYWTPSFALCQPPQPFEGQYTSHAFFRDPCQEALIADMKVDLASFAEQNDQGADYLASLLEGANYLMARDQGTIDELQTLRDELDTWAVREPFIEQVLLVAEALDQAEVRQVVYNMVMSTIERTEFAPSADYAAKFIISTRTLKWDGKTTAAKNALLLMHEASHGWTGVAHVICPEGTLEDDTDYSGQRVCDDEWDGAWGFQAASARLMMKGCETENPASLDQPEQEMYRAATFIIAE
jgi:hypothetical protein